MWVREVDVGMMDGYERTMGRDQDTDSGQLDSASG